MPRRGGAIAEPREPFKPVTTDPLPRASDAHTGRRSRRYDRPTLIDNKLAEAPPASPTESRVSVQIHPVTSLGAELPLTALSLQGGPDEPTSSGTTPRRGRGRRATQGGAGRGPRPRRRRGRAACGRPAGASSYVGDGAAWGSNVPDHRRDSFEPVAPYGGSEARTGGGTLAFVAVLERHQDLVDELIAEVEGYKPDADRELVTRAFDFAARAHDGQLRRSGQEFIYHPWGAAKILAG